MATIPSTSLYPATSGVYPSGAQVVEGIVPRLEVSSSIATTVSGG
jgi:hypothetical protein